jgi:hypothetical protein
VRGGVRGKAGWASRRRSAASAVASSVAPAIDGAIADVAAVLHQVPVDGVYEIVGLCLRGRDAVAEAHCAQDASAGGHDARAAVAAGFDASAGVKYFTRELGGGLQPEGWDRRCGRRPDSRRPP